MTAEQRFERELPDLLADLYPVSAPDYRDDLVRQIAATRQRPAWAPPERWIPVNVLVRIRPVRALPWRTIGVVALLLIALAAVAIIAGSRPRQLPAPFGPADNGQLVVSEGGDVFLIDSGTGKKTLAIGGATWDVEPIFSRDGTRIAFFRETNGVRGLWLADGRGVILRELSTAGLVAVSQIEWSPDGASILVTSLVGAKAAPAIVPTDGSAAHIVALDMPAESPIWLPNGEILFRGVQSTGFGLFAIRPDGTVPRTVVPAKGTQEFDALFYAPSPDGSAIAYQWRETSAAKQRIYVVPTAGGTPRGITSVESVGPIWSPDGTWIAFWSVDGTYVVRADGTAPERRLMPMTGAKRWTPDGGRLLFFGEGASDQLLLNPIDGSRQTAPWSAVRDSFPDWQRLGPKP